jgi:hypothetical protein
VRIALLSIVTRTLPLLSLAHHVVSFALFSINLIDWKQKINTKELERESD